VACGRVVDKRIACSSFLRLYPGQKNKALRARNLMAKPSRRWTKNSRSKGRYAEAEEVYSAVLVEAEKFGPEDRRVALTLNKLAGLYHARGTAQSSRTALPAGIG
jgi:hypothetical protein